MEKGQYSRKEEQQFRSCEQETEGVGGNEGQRCPPPAKDVVSVSILHARK